MRKTRDIDRPSYHSFEFSMNVRMRSVLVSNVLASLLLTGCVIGQNAVTAPSDEEASTLLVGSAALGEPTASIARHPWIALKVPDEAEWERWEVMCCPTKHRGTVRRTTHCGPLSDHG
jgi:hypothetical protein